MSKVQAELDETKIILVSKPASGGQGGRPVVTSTVSAFQSRSHRFSESGDGRLSPRVRRHSRPAPSLSLLHPSAALLYEGPSWAPARPPAALALHSLGCGAPCTEPRPEPRAVSGSGSSLLLRVLTLTYTWPMNCFCFLFRFGPGGLCP